VSIIVDISMVLIVLIDGPEEAKEQDISASDYKHVSFSFIIGLVVRAFLKDFGALRIVAQAYAFSRPTFFAGLGTISFAFICQHSSFMIYRSLQNPTLPRWQRVTN